MEKLRDTPSFTAVTPGCISVRAARCRSKQITECKRCCCGGGGGIMNAAGSGTKGTLHCSGSVNWWKSYKSQPTGGNEKEVAEFVTANVLKRICSV